MKLRDELISNILGIFISLGMIVFELYMAINFKNLFYLGVYLFLVILFVLSSKIISLVITISLLKGKDVKKIDSINKINEAILKVLFIGIWPVVSLFLIYRYIETGRSKLLLYGVLLLIGFIYTLYNKYNLSKNKSNDNFTKKSKK